MTASPMQPERLAPGLPVPPTPLVGRAEDVRAVLGLLAEDGVRLVTLIGPGGAGKTRLALEVAHAVAGRVDGEAVFVPLAPEAAPHQIVPAIARAMGLWDDGDRPPLETLVAALWGRSPLLVLDNVEHLVAGAPAVAELMAASPGLAILATSRVPLRLRGEHLVPVPPLPVPRPGATLAVADLARNPAVALFVQRARAARPDFSLTEANSGVVAEIVRRLDGLPLAIELAATRCRLLSPQALLARLASRLTLLTGGERDLPERHQTLRAAIAWSHDLLSLDEQALFRRLSVFSDGFTLAAAEAIAEGERGRDGEGESSFFLSPSVLDGIAALADQSLLWLVDGSAGEPRFGMLETIREYGLERLAESGEADEVRRRHAEWLLILVDEAATGLMGPAQEAWLDRLETEAGNLRVALAWAVDRPDPELALRLAAGLRPFWELRGIVAERRDWLERVLARSASVRSRHRAAALDGAGTLAALQGDRDHAARLIAEALALRRELGDQEGVAESLSSLGMLAQERGDLDAAEEYETEALTLRRRLGTAWQVAKNLNGLGIIASMRGDLERGAMLFEESLAVSRETGDKRGQAVALSNLGNLARFTGDRPRASRLITESLGLLRDVGNKRGIADALNNLAAIAHDEGDLDRAGPLYEQSLAVRREIGDRWGVTLALHNLGVAAADRRDYRAAARLLVEALLEKQALGDPAGTESSLREVARVASACRLPARGARLAGAAEALREAISTPLLPAQHDEYEQTLADLRSGLGAEALAAAWAAGRNLSPAEAVAEAVEVADEIEYPLTASFPATGDSSVATSAPRVLAHGLTPRELDVLAQLAQGRSNADIAESLFISPLTAKTHVERILGKLGATSRAEAAVIAVREGLA